MSLSKEQSAIRRRALLCSVAAGLLLLGGCAPWPEEATGGLAERHPTDWVAGRAMEERFVALMKAGADARMPARMLDARDLLIRARREHAGGLVKDAEITLGTVDLMLVSIERELPRSTALMRHMRAER